MYNCSFWNSSVTIHTGAQPRNHRNDLSASSGLPLDSSHDGVSGICLNRKIYDNLTDKMVKKFIGGRSYYNQIAEINHRTHQTNQNQSSPFQVNIQEKHEQGPETVSYFREWKQTTS